MSDRIPNRQNWNFSYGCSDMNVDELTSMYVREYLIKTQRIFKYNNLPDTIPQRDLELILQSYGHATITEVDGKLYAFYGNLGGVLNAYYQPTLSVVANPFLKFNKSLEIDKDCVVIRSDSMYVGLMPIIQENAYLLAQCDVSFKFGAVNSRVTSILGAPDDTTYESAKLFFEQIEKGKNLGVIKNDDLYKSIESYNIANASGSIISLIELRQYILGSFYNRLGVQAPFNMKREALNTSENALNEDVLYPLIDDMLLERQKGLEKINNMYGTNISVELDSVWKQLRDQLKMEIEMKEAVIQREEKATEETQKEVINED